MEDPKITSDEEFYQFLKDVKKNTRIKECIFPDHTKCEGKIIDAHSIQNSKILLKLAEGGHVFMLSPKNDSSHEYGRNEASIFNGFCKYHDQVVFQPIEDGPFYGSPIQIFLYTYRAFAFSYLKRREAVLFMDNLINDERCIDKDLAIEMKKSYELAVKNFEEEKVIFDRALLSRDFHVLTSFVWEFPYDINFASNGVETMPLDFDGNKLQDITDPINPARNIYLSVFPWEGKSYAIISWISLYNELFKPIFKRLRRLTDLEKINFLNNTIPIATENTAFKISSWNKLTEEQLKDFLFLFYRGAEIYEADGIAWDRFQSTSYNLFEL